MLKSIWTAALYQPLYNLFILILSVMPGGDAGLAIVILTVITKVVLFPLNQRMIESQIKLSNLQPEIDRIKKDYPDKMEQAKKTQEFYKTNKINPFSSCLPLLVQIFVLIALYQVFRGIVGLAELPSLYAFVTAPESINLHLFGFIDLSTKHNIVFAILTAATQFFQARLMQKRQKKPEGDGMQHQIARSMQSQMVYTMPLMMAFISYIFPTAVALYLITSNIFTIGQEMYTLRKLRDGRI